MEIPQTVIFRNRKYIFVKEYKDYVRYMDTITMCMTCFTKHELGLVKETIKPDTHVGSIGIRKL